MAHLQNGGVPYFDDQLFHGVPGNLNPWDVRFDPSDAAVLSIDAAGRVRFRLITEPSFRRAIDVPTLEPEFVWGNGEIEQTDEGITVTPLSGAVIIRL